MRNGTGSDITKKQKDLLRLKRELDIIRKKLILFLAYRSQNQFSIRMRSAGKLN